MQLHELFEGVAERVSLTFVALPGEESRPSRSPSSPTSAGQVPMFRQPAAASRNASGGSSNETNSPGRTPRIVCVEISERINASPRLLSNHASLVQRRARKQEAAL